MKILKRTVTFLGLVALMFLIPKIVSAEKSINEILEEGSYTFKSVPPTCEEDTYVIFSSFYEQYQGYDLKDCNKAYTHCQVTYQGTTVGELDINYVYEKNMKEKVDSMLENIPMVMNMKDMEYINYLLYGYTKNPYELYSDEWYKIEEKNISVRYNYATELRKALNYKNFTITPGMGWDTPLSSFVQGYGPLEYDDTIYGVIDGIQVYSDHIIYLENNTTDIIKGIRDRLTSVFGNVIDGVEITKLTSIYDEDTEANYENVTSYINGTIAYWQDLYEDFGYNSLEECLEENASILSKIENAENAENEFYNLKINGVDWAFVVILDSSKIDNDINLTTSDIATDISISTDNANIPLDALITAKSVNDNSIKDKIDTENYVSYDISLYSNALGDNIKKLDNGKFEVKIPVPSELNNKDLIVYYVTSTNELEEHEVTIKNGYAIFETNHFSTYTLAEKVEQEPVDPPKGEDNNVITIKEVNVTLDAPVIGDKVTAKEVDFGGYGGYEQDNKPNVTVSDNANYTIDGTNWIKGTYKEVGDDFEEYFSGTFEKDKYYYAVIYISAKDGYALDSDVSIKVNGEAPAKVFAVFNNGESTFFIAKIKSQNAPTTIKTKDSKVSATFKDGETEGYELSVKEIEVSKDLSKKGVKTVFDINVLKDDKIVKISDREVSVTIDLDESLQGFKYYKVAYIEDGKIKEELPATVKDGKLTFTTTHFSEYGIIASNAEITTPKTGDNIIFYVATLSLSILAIASGTFIMKKRKN